MVQKRGTRITGMLLTLMTVVILIVKYDTGNISLLELLDDEISHVVLGLDLVWEVLFLVDETEWEEDSLLELEELGLVTEVLVEFVKEVCE